MMRSNACLMEVGPCQSRCPTTASVVIVQDEEGCVDPGVTPGAAHRAVKAGHGARLFRDAAGYASCRGRRSSSSTGLNLGLRDLAVVAVAPTWVCG